MKKIITIFSLLIFSYTIWAQNNVITYTASAKLEETTDWISGGLHTNAFDVSILSHDFLGTTGTITFSGDVTSIGEWAFYDCSGLTSIDIPNSVTSIGYAAFRGCSVLTSITIPNSVTSIGSYAFYVCSSLTSITIPNSVTSIGYYAFDRCSSLTSITIPSSVTSIVSSAFEDCSNLTSIVVESGNLKYDSRNNCNAIIETATNTLIVGCMNSSIPNSVTSIGLHAFYSCAGLTSIDIPNSVTNIGNGAFYGCSSLTSITIPNSVTSIGERAFYRCSSLTSITCYAEEPPTCYGDCFYNVPRSIPLYVPASSISLYQAAEQWNEFDIQPLLVEIDSIAPDSINITWLPVDSAAMYQLHIYSNQTALDTTLTIFADSDNGGVLSQGGEAAPERLQRIVLDDEAGTLVVIVVDYNSGLSRENPFVVTVSTTSKNRIDISYDFHTFGENNNLIHQEMGMFTLNETTQTYEALEEISFSTFSASPCCFDLYGHRYPISEWSSLPAGIYILREGGEARKIMKQ